jgi:hypothetical protein
VCSIVAFDSAVKSATPLPSCEATRDRLIMPVLHTEMRRRGSHTSTLPPAPARSLSLKPPHSAPRHWHRRPARFLSVRADRPLPCTRATKDSDLWSYRGSRAEWGGPQSIAVVNRFDHKEQKSRNVNGRVASACNHVLLRGRKRLLQQSQQQALDNGPKRRDQLV